MKQCYALGLLLLVVLAAALTGPASAAMDGWDYYQEISYSACDQDVYQQDVVIHRMWTTEAASETEAGGLNVWYIGAAAHCQEDYGDIRFTDAAGTELDYYLWPDYDAETARFCVRLEGATSAGTVKVWYGNSAAETTSDGSTTFLLYADFEDSNSPFTSGTASVSYVGGYSSENTDGLDPDSKSLKLYGGGSAKARYSLQQIGQGTQVEYYQYIPTSNPTSSLGGIYLAVQSPMEGYQCILDERGSGPNLHLQIRENFVYPPSVGGSLYLGNIDGHWHRILVTWAQDGTITFCRTHPTTGELYDSVTWTDLSYSSGKIGFCTYDTTYFDHITIRTYSAAPPAATTFGTETETNPASPTPTTGPTTAPTPHPTPDPSYTLYSQISTEPATDITASSVTIQGDITGTEDCFFVWGSKSGRYAYTTDWQEDAGGAFSEEISGLPLVGGHTYYYRAGCELGYGEEMSVTLADVEPVATTTYTDAYDDLIGSMDNLSAMPGAVAQPFSSAMGGLPIFTGFLFFMIFGALVVRQEDVAIPTILGLILAGSLVAGDQMTGLVPPEIVGIAYSLLVVSLIGIVYVIARGRR